MTHVNTLKKIFPEPPDKIYQDFMIDHEGMWSITHPQNAQIISNMIIKIMNTSDLKIFDMMAGCGGNMISFINTFSFVTGAEIDNDRYIMLKNNIEKYNKSNYKLILDDSLNHIDDTHDVYFMDPPWGGPDYKKLTSCELYIQNKSLKEITQLIPKNKLIILKLPYNYNIEPYSDYILEKIIINNIIILFIRY